jgi:aminopeptidase YwaD
MSSSVRAFLLVCVAASVLLAAACGGSGGSNGPEAASSTGEATEAASTGDAASSQLPHRSEPDAARAMQHLRTLADNIGSRPATTDREREAAEYIRGQLEAAGYEATLEEFDVQATLGGSGGLWLPDGTEVEAAPLSGSVNGAFEGQLVAAGLGRASDFQGVDASGKFVLLDRGQITFAEKVRNAQAAGATGVIVANNEPGLFRGDLGGEPVRIPAVSIAQESRSALEPLLGGDGRLTIEVDTNRVSGTSQNVVGKPSDAPCTAYLGAHYDSVPAGPGANDNASGTSVMLELARARRFEGLCVIAFGAEEVGLFGSRAYVREHDEVADAVFMMNFDMVAKMTRPTFIGEEALTAQAAQVAADQGLEARTVASFGRGTSSDHASFQEVGVPVLMFYSGDDEFIHTAQDDIDNVSQDDLGRFLDIAVTVLDQLLAA